MQTSLPFSVASVVLVPLLPSPGGEEEEEEEEKEEEEEEVGECVGVQNTNRKSPRNHV